MATFNKLALCPSGTEGTGAGILVVGTGSGSSATPVHTGSTTTTTYDELWLYASNTSTTDNKLTIEYGGTTAGFTIVQTISGQSGLILIVPGLIIKGAASPVEVKAWSTTTGSVVNIFGYINRITA